MLPDIGFDVYPILIVLGFLLDFVFLELYFKKIGMKKGVSTNLEIALTISGIVGIVCAVLFQNLYDLIEKGKDYKWTWAMTFFGGLIGGTAMFFLLYFVVLKKKNPPFLTPLMTIAGPCVPFAHGLGRIGCFLDGCCYGKETDSIFGIKFATTTTKVWPTNLFEAIFLLLLAGILFYLAYRHRSRYTFPIYMMSYGVFRFLIEFLRGDHRGNFIPGISPSQFWSLLLLIGGIIYLVYILLDEKKNRSKTES